MAPVITITCLALIKFQMDPGPAVKCLIFPEKPAIGVGGA